MNIALGTILIFLIIIPGILNRRAYFLSNEVGLAFILLAGSSRRLLSDDPGKKNKFEKIPTDRY